MTEFLAHQPIAYSMAAFALAAALIAYFGIKMTSIARDLSALTRIGECPPRVNDKECLAVAEAGLVIGGEAGVDVDPAEGSGGILAGRI